MYTILFYSHEIKEFGLRVIANQLLPALKLVMSGDEKLRQKLPEMLPQMLPQMLTNVSFVYTSTKGRDLQQKCSEEELDHFYDLIAIISADGDWDSINVSYIFSI